QPDTDAAVFGGLRNDLRLHGIAKKLNAVLNLDVAKTSDHFGDRRRIACPERQEIEIPGRPKPHPAPNHEQHGSLEYKSILEGRKGNAPEKAFGGVPLKDELEV